MNKYPISRRGSGQALVEGTVMLAIQTALSVAMILLILGVGTVQMYQLKLLNVAQVMAQEMIGDTFWQGRQVNPKPTSMTTEQQAKTTSLLRAVGLPSNSGDYDVQITDDGNNCIYNLTLRGLPIFGGGILPNVVTLSARAVQPWSSSKPPFFVTIATSIGPIAVPSYRPQGYAGFPSITPVSTGGGPMSAFVNLSVGTGATGINLGGYGTAPASGSPTHTGGMQGAFAPYVGSAFPQPSSYPEF